MKNSSDTEHPLRDFAGALVVIAAAWWPLRMSVETNNPHWLWLWVPMGIALLLGLAG